MNLEDNIHVAQLLGNISALREHQTSKHNIRVAYLSSLLGKINLSKKAMQGLMKGAFLHDIGKVGIPDNILLKNGSLDEKEWNIMIQHPQIGVDLVKDIQWFSDAIPVILQHHEKFDGTGYPAGLKGSDITFNARVFSIVDVFDALIFSRPYKKSFSFNKSLKIIKEGQATHFDPEVVEPFELCAEEFYSIVKECSVNELKAKLENRRKHVFGL